MRSYFLTSILWIFSRKKDLRFRLVPQRLMELTLLLSFSELAKTMNRRLTSPVNVFAKIIGDPKIFSKIRDGDKVDEM